MPWKDYGSNPAYGRSAWKKARKAALESARYRCQIAGPGCTGRATEVDHIHGLAADPGHQYLRAVCSTCHGKRTASQGHAGRGRGAADPPFQPRTRW